MVMVENEVRVEVLLEQTLGYDEHVCDCKHPKTKLQEEIPPTACQDKAMSTSKC